MQGAPEYAHEYFSEAESVESSTYRELLGVLRCFQSLMHLCADKFVVFQVDAKHFLGIVNRGSPRIKLNALVREMFWLGGSIGLPLRWNGSLGNRTHWRMSPLSCSSRRTSASARHISCTWRVDGDSTRWACSRPIRTTFAGDSTPCIGAEGREACMPSLITRAGRPLGSTALIGWWIVCGESCITTGV